MKKILDFFLSSKATLILLAIIGIAMAVATFIEDKYDTITAKVLVYNTTWMEILFLLLILNLIGHIKSYKLFSKKKLGGLMFHLAFVVMIIGAGITRYFGTEGNMHIRKGDSSNIVYTSEAYLMISYKDNTHSFAEDYPVSNGYLNKNNFAASFQTNDKGKVEVKFNRLIHNAVSKIEENIEGGKDFIELSMASTKGMQSLQLEKGDYKTVANISYSFGNDRKADINIVENDGKLYISASDIMVQTNMNETEADTLEKDSLSEFKESYVYHTNNSVFLFSKFYKKAKKVLQSASMDGNGMGVDVVVLDVDINGKTHQVNVFENQSSIAEFEDFSIDGLKLKLAYGCKPVELPFSLFLRDFIFEKYPGSDRPSSYRSEVTLIDKRKNLAEDHSIYMNNVLDYDKYRFFQSSYDTDEQGTVLSVNHDYWGTLVSYIGYTLLGIGFLITLFNKNSRFLILRNLIKEVRVKRKSLTMMVLFLTGIGFSGFSQNTAVVNEKHVEKFGKLLTQTYDGRFAPLHTLALDVMHKVSKKENFNIEGKGKMNAMQVFIDMIAEPQFWQQQKIIYVPQQAIRDIIGVNSEYVAFTDFFNEKSEYKLDKYISESFRKSQNEKNKFDREILKVDERLNIFYMTINGSILKIFPEQNSKNNKWISWDDKTAMIPLTGAINIINEDLKLKVFNYSGIMSAYMMELIQARATGDYTKADKILSYISDIQIKNSDRSLLPSDSKINAEIFYNKADIFIFLKNIYMILSVLLLGLAFVENIKAKKSKYISLVLNILTIVLGLAFLYHSYGMALRWYITGHAPWANGYEALILVAWGALLAGFCFAKISKLTLAATTLLAFFVLMTAGHSSYDPQLTNLQPVLKSYWLIIHVATLTISYGFLGLGFILGIINLIIYLMKNNENSKRFDLLIAENSYIIEMNLIIGLILATLGTFLGAVWANESWGRYWGWDAKETWALIIVITYSFVIHMRFIPKLNTKYAFNVASVLGFASVIMTFVGVNYYLSKGMHSYGAGDTPIFPLWAWGTIFATIILIVTSGIKESKNQLNK